MKKLQFIICVILFLGIYTSCERYELLVSINQATFKSLKTADTKANDKLTGFDQCGYNWNAHHFNGYLINAIIGDFLFKDYPHYKYSTFKGEGVPYWDELVNNFDYFIYFVPPELLDCKLAMHWNEKLISNKGVYPEKWMDSNGWITFHFINYKDGKK